MGDDLNGARDSCRASVERCVVVSVRRAGTVAKHEIVVRCGSFDRGRKACLVAIDEYERIGAEKNRGWNGALVSPTRSPLLLFLDSKIRREARRLR